MKYTPQELQKMIMAPTGGDTSGFAAPPTMPSPNSGLKCRAKCVGGNACICNAKYRHQLHACKDVDCTCHSREYLDSKRRVAK